MGQSRTADDTDAIIGANLRRLRRTKCITQQKLAKGLGVSYQQVQKYETGSNRIAASTLVDVCRIVACGIDELFINIDVGNRRLDGREPISGLATMAASAFDGIPNPKLRKAILAFMRDLQPSPTRDAQREHAAVSDVKTCCCDV